MLSSRAAVRRLFEEETDDLTDWNLPLIAAEITQAVRDNPELLAAFVNEALPSMVYEVGYSVMTNQRVSQRRLDAATRAVEAVVLPATDPPSRVRGQLLRPTRQSKGFDWLRQPLSVAAGRTIRLASARKADLALALARDESRLRPARQRTMHRKLLHDALPDGDQAVGDVFDEDQIGALWLEAGNRVAAEDRANALADKALSDRKTRPALPAGQ